MRDELSRRRFLQASALGLGGLIAAACESRPDSSDTAVAGRARAPGDTAGGGSRVAHIGVQLYTVRDLMKADMPGTLRSIAEIGYPEVEFAGYYDREPQAVRDMLDQLRLKAPSGHVPLEVMRTDAAGAIAAAKVIGHRYLIVPWLQPPKTIEAWRGLASEFNRFGTACREGGVQFAYHNHEFEFTPIAGTMPYDVLLQECDPELVKMQLDLFWAVKGGQDPVAYFDKHPGRFPLVHVKDMRDLAGAQEMVDVGAGDIDFRRIFAKADKAGLVHYVAEHDNPQDPMATLRTSYANLRRMLA